MAKTTTKTVDTEVTTTAVPAFEFFEGNLSESSSSPQVTVRRGGLMVLTAAAAEMLGEGVEKVQLAYDRSSKTVGIRAASGDAPGAYLLRRQVKSPNRLVGGKRFFTYNGIATEKAVTFESVRYGDGLIGFRMSGGGIEVGAA